MRIDWAEKNIFMNYDEPARLVYDTEGATLRFRIYETWDSNQAIYVDDTATNTNRTGKGILDLWSTNPHGTPSSTTVNIYTITIEVYDASNRLLETRKLSYAYTRKGVTYIYVKDENNQDLIAQINYVTVYNNDRYFRTYSGTFITIPYPDNPTQSYLEILSVKSRDRKYYMIDRFDRIGTGAGTYNIKLAPRDKIIVYMDVTITNDIITKLMSIPGLNYVTSFLINLGINILNFGLVIGNYIRELLGLKDYYVVKAEKISDNPLVIRFYYRTDIAPLLAVIILGSIICGTIITWVIATAIRDMRVAEMTYETQKVITERYTQYTKLVDKVIDFCKTQPDSQKCYNEIIPTITQPNTGSDEAKNTQDSLTATIETLKQFLYIAVVIAVILAVISYLRK